VFDAHDPSKKHRPMVTTADLSLRFDPIYEPIARRYQQNPEKFADGLPPTHWELPLPTCPVNCKLRLN